MRARLRPTVELSSSPRTSHSTSAWCVRWRTADTDWTVSGTTISTTARSLPSADAARLLQRPSRCAAGVRVGGEYGYLFQGQRYAWQKQARGTRAGRLDPATFVNFIENHDQLANTGDGSRLRASTTPGRYRAMSALFLLMPGTPLLFQGQEFGASARFLFFADHRPELAAAVQKGAGGVPVPFPGWHPARCSENCRRRTIGHVRALDPRLAGG